jgi:hypothetical protein
MHEKIKAFLETMEPHGLEGKEYSFQSSCPYIYLVMFIIHGIKCS